jgi:hypothetical protein
VRELLTAYIRACGAGKDEFRLTPRAEPTSYARCFSVFLQHLLMEPGLATMAEALSQAIVRDLKDQRSRPKVDIHGKPYRQLLTFSLSALAVLPGASPCMLDEFVEEQLFVRDIHGLRRMGCLDGRAGSGNQAMFDAIFLIHGRDHMGLETQPLIDEWIDLHLRNMNRFGFWGKDSGMTHLLFQNGYHQHEVFEYLGVKNPKIEMTLPALRSLADKEGHFAPFPGGGGCYDYDAVFMLTPEGRLPNEATRALLLRTAATIESEQRPDGGFSESVRVRPRSLKNSLRFASHTLGALGNRPLFTERLRHGLTLHRFKYDRVQTHWSRYSRRWDESDLWDTWFRMLTLARIEVAMQPERASQWGFIDYPGIGYHPSLRAKSLAY